MDAEEAAEKAARRAAQSDPDVGVAE
jgi:hypothetical protein